MSRTREQLVTLFLETKENYKREFGVEFNSEGVRKVLREDIELRHKKFTYKYLGHISSADLFNFALLLEEDSVAPILVAKEPVAPPAVELPKSTPTPTTVGTSAKAKEKVKRVS